MITLQIARLTKRIVITKISAHVAESLDDIQHCPNKNKGTGVRSIMRKVVEFVFIAALRQDGASETTERHISSPVILARIMTTIAGKKSSQTPS